ncbi:uncharacterized protein LOC132032130 [Lycium ferocissimum]|uniref:uncharacterized protein LOC132032130 n=1 Tax=Lycium ferocissimum TaxID=112874 RepID=UPI002814C04D|nr:uncharacterized protein LOC132032130 [Lycium ferocissimum]
MDLLPIRSRNEDGSERRERPRSRTIYQKKSDAFDKILEDIQDSDEEIELDSIISQKELMESSASSSSPFQRITGEQYTVDTSTGNVPRRRVFRTAGEPIDNIKPSGKRMPIEEPIILQEGGNKGKILNIAAHDPQRWNSVIDLWKGIVVTMRPSSSQTADKGKGIALTQDAYRQKKNNKSPAGNSRSQRGGVSKYGGRGNISDACDGVIAMATLTSITCNTSVGFQGDSNCGGVGGEVGHSSGGCGGGDGHGGGGGGGF